MTFSSYYRACLEWFIVELIGLIVVVGVLLPSAAGAVCDV